MPSAGKPSARALRARRLEARLAERYGKPTRRRRDPLEELVLTILSQNTTDRNSGRAWRSLRAAFPDWESIRAAEPAELARTVRVAGLATQKAASIQAALERLVDEVGEPSLAHLEAMDDAEATDYLESFRGVGVKTAACVLCFALGRPVMPVDTHVHRLASRLGLVSVRGGAAAAHRVLNREVPPELRFRLHVQLIRHGRDTCTARAPACDACAVSDLCPRIGVENERNRA